MLLIHNIQITLAFIFVMKIYTWKNLKINFNFRKGNNLFFIQFKRKCKRFLNFQINLEKTIFTVLCTTIARQNNRSYLSTAKINEYNRGGKTREKTTTTAITTWISVFPLCAFNRQVFYDLLLFRFFQLHSLVSNGLFVSLTIDLGYWWISNAIILNARSIWMDRVYLSYIHTNFRITFA